jgi:hypothetical protein
MALTVNFAIGFVLRLSLISAFFCSVTAQV